MSHASIYDEEFLTVREAASEVGISLTQFRDLLAFDAAKGRPGEESQFPNAYKATPAINSPIRIPVRDIERYKRTRTGEPHPIGYDFAAASGNGSGEVVFAEVSPA